MSFNFFLTFTVSVVPGAIIINDVHYCNSATSGGLQVALCPARSIGLRDWLKSRNFALEINNV